MAMGSRSRLAVLHQNQLHLAAGNCSSSGQLRRRYRQLFTVCVDMLYV
jgi:hypothetical protein